MIFSLPGSIEMDVLHKRLKEKLYELNRMDITIIARNHNTISNQIVIEFESLGEQKSIHTMRFDNLVIETEYSTDIHHFTDIVDEFRQEKFVTAWEEYREVHDL